MKRYFTLICCLLSLKSDLFARTNELPARPPVLHTLAAEAVRQYQSVTDSLTGNVSKYSEANFWLRYKRLMYAYEAQWSRTVQYTELLQNDPPKQGRKALKALETGNYAAAVDAVTPALNAKKAAQKNPDAFRFLMKMSIAAADYKRGVEFGWKFLQSGAATIEDSLLYAECLKGLFAFDEAMAVTELLDSAHSRDTLFTARMRYLRAIALHGRMDTVRALAPLIEAAYMLRQLPAAPQRDEWLRKVDLEMTDLYSAQNDFDNSLKSALEARLLSHRPAELAAAQLALGALYAKAGGMAKAELLIDSAYRQYAVLYDQDPDLWGQRFCEAIEANAMIQRWYDRNDRYQQLLEEEAKVLRQLSQFGFVPHRFALARTYFSLGHKFMNMDLKIGPAEQAWQLADTQLTALVKENVVYAGDLYVDNNYKLAGCKSAFKKDAEAKVFFLRSLEVRRKLYAIAPKAFSHDLATVLVQNANFDANEKHFPEAVAKMEEAEARAKESNDERMLEEIVNFRDFLKNKIKK